MKYEDSAKQEMWDWFHELFIRPSECVPRMSEKSGYQYICGGPFFADEELKKEFSEKYPENAIEEVIADLESEDTEWAKKKHYDYS